MQIHYFLAPAAETFDMEQLEARLGALPGAAKLPDEEPTYLIAAGPELARELAAAAEFADLSGQGLIVLSPTGLDVYQDASEAVLRQIREFVTWLFETTPCRVYSEEGEDWTERYVSNPGALFEEEPI